MDLRQLAFLLFLTAFSAAAAADEPFAEVSIIAISAGDSRAVLEIDEKPVVITQGSEFSLGDYQYVAREFSQDRVLFDEYQEGALVGYVWLSSASSDFQRILLSPQ